MQLSTLFNFVVDNRISFFYTHLCSNEFILSSSVTALQFTVKKEIHNV